MAMMPEEKEPAWQEKVNILTSETLAPEFIKEKNLILNQESHIQALTKFVIAFTVPEIFLGKKTPESELQQEAYLAIRKFFTHHIEILFPKKERVFSSTTNELISLLGSIGWRKIKTLPMIKDFYYLEWFMGSEDYYYPEK